MRHGTVYPKKYAHGFCFAVLCCGYTLTDFPISIRLTSLALWQSNDCPSASKATLMNMDKYFMWIHYERLHNHNKAKHNKTVCIFIGIYCISGRAVDLFSCNNSDLVRLGFCDTALIRWIKCQYGFHSLSLFRLVVRPVCDQLNVLWIVNGSPAIGVHNDSGYPPRLLSVNWIRLVAESKCSNRGVMSGFG